MKYANEYNYQVYVDRKDGRGFELSAWYDYFEEARKEANFLVRKGYEVEIRTK